MKYFWTKAKNTLNVTKLKDKPTVGYKQFPISGNVYSRGYRVIYGTKHDKLLF